MGRVLGVPLSICFILESTFERVRVDRRCRRSLVLRFEIHRLLVFIRRGYGSTRAKARGRQSVKRCSDREETKGSSEGGEKGVSSNSRSWAL